MVDVMYLGIGIVAGAGAMFGIQRFVLDKAHLDTIKALESKAEQQRSDVDNRLKACEIKESELKKDAQLLEKQKESILKEAETKAEMLQKEKMLQAKERFLQLKSEHDKSVTEKNQVIKQAEEKLKEKQGVFDKKVEELKKRHTDVEQQRKEIEKEVQALEDQKKAVQSMKEALELKEQDMEQLRQQHIQKLERVAQLTAEEAKNQLAEQMRAEAKSVAMSYIKDITDEAKMTANKEAKRIVIQTIQRVATESAVENSVSVFNIENDDIKGRIIGREGRNIRTLEALTGVEIIVDDTPEAIVLSCFDPVRREIARLALQQLVADGRIHPARIEEVVGKTKKMIEEEIIETGKRTILDLGIHGLHPELIRMVGRMKYRSSYGQNLLQHSREVANLCAIMAAELGLNVKMAKRAGLLHDIGKVPDDEPELPHAILGMKLAEKYKEKPEICNAIGAHHDEIEMTTLIAPIIQVCDAISGARPGARREISEAYIKRLKDLEALALSYPGVANTYAIQAGRELRVVVESDKINDQQASTLAFDISQKVQNEMTYPGQVKVTVIRETRAIGYAK